MSALARPVPPRAGPGLGPAAAGRCSPWPSMSASRPCCRWRSGAEPERLAAVATGAAFAALALASLLSLERMFERDFEDGGLDLLVLGRPVAGRGLRR